MDPLALASLTSRLPISAPPMEAESGGLVINVFWILVVAANFLIFLVAAWYLGLRNVPRNLGARRERIEQSLKDADAARQEREQAAAERQAVLVQARQESEDDSCPCAARRGREPRARHGRNTCPARADA